MYDISICLDRVYVVPCHETVDNQLRSRQPVWHNFVGLNRHGCAHSIAFFDKEIETIFRQS